jgi:hypothetical protein
MNAIDKSVFVITISHWLVRTGDDSKPGFCSRRKGEIHVMQEKVRIAPPLFLLEGLHKCDECRKQIEVVALLAPRVLNFKDVVGGRVAILSDTTDLPQEILAFIQSRNPAYTLREHRFGGRHVYVNSCPDCGEMADDFYLQAESDGPFFPMNRKEAAQLRMTEVPLQEALDIDTGLGFGLGDLILRDAKRARRLKFERHQP